MGQQHLEPGIFDMTAQRHRSAAIMLRSRYRRVISGQADPERSPYWGHEIWPVLAAEHERRAQKIDLSLANTSELEAVVDSVLPG